MRRTGSSRSSRAERLALAVTLAVAVWITLPPLWRSAREAWAMRLLTFDQRRTHMLGPLYPSILRLRKELRPREPVAIVLHAPADADLGVYVNHYLYPHPTRMYFGTAAYRADPHAPRTIAYIDREQAWEVRRLRGPLP